VVRRALAALPAALPELAVDARRELAVDARLED
jgi:hypothetical protein